MSKLLKPCPFCGGEPSINVRYCTKKQFEQKYTVRNRRPYRNVQFVDYVDTVFVGCIKCGATSAHIDVKHDDDEKICKEELNKIKLEAVKLWNTRVN